MALSAATAEMRTARIWFPGLFYLCRFSSGYFAVNDQARRNISSSNSLSPRGKARPISKCQPSNAVSAGGCTTRLSITKHTRIRIPNALSSGLVRFHGDKADLLSVGQVILHGCRYRKYQGKLRTRNSSFLSSLLMFSQGGSNLISTIYLTCNYR
jgi:hypothetical protein